MLKSLPPIFKNRIFQHVLFWTVHLVFYGVLHGIFYDNYKQTFFEEALYLPVKMLLTYFVLYFLLPKYILTGKYIEFTILFLISSFAAGTAQRILAFTIDFPLYYPEYLNEPLFYVPKIIKTFVYIYQVVFTAVMIKLLKYWYANKQVQQVLFQEKLQAELKFLKTQIHPHFLFNTLNNLYALTLKKSDRAPEMVLKLSELINYMLYECTGDEVNVSREIKFLQNYIDIEKMRYGDKLEVDFRVHGEVTNRKMAPLLLLPFIENCFKHGASEELDSCWVKIQINLDHHSISTKIENSVAAKNGAAKKPEGIGIQNAKRRLELLYPGMHDLKIFEGQETFLVVLTIENQ